ncbi:MAG: hypothetical protein GEU93_08585 [Propionibacteriales bacterium]|nr:hypothetical protein [Propionibacteriales bacterium]
MTEQLIASDVQRETPRETTSANAAVEGMRSFGHALLAEHPELLRDGNAVVSSASIGTAFAMLRPGAEGETAEQIDDVLGFPANGLGPAYNFLTDQWMATGEDAPELSVANSLFVQEGFALKEPFLDALARDFGAGVRAVAFMSGDATAVIDDWVRRETRDRIKKLFDRLSPATMLVLANAIYLKARWVHQFSPYATGDEEFHRADGGLVDVPHMHQTTLFDHADGDGWSAVRLPYRGGELSMWVLLPDAGGDPLDLLDPATLASAAESARPVFVKLSLPRWDFESDMPLNAALQAMGMTRAFTGAAEFPGVSDVSLSIDQVRHRAVITVDEEGTEAAAVTGIAMRVSLTVPRDPVEFAADHPFAFVITHDPSGAPLFEGVVGDPSA